MMPGHLSVLDPSTALPGHLQETGSEMEQPERELAPKWDAVVRADSFTCYTIMLGPIILFYTGTLIHFPSYALVPLHNMPHGRSKAEKEVEWFQARGSGESGRVGP